MILHRSPAQFRLNALRRSEAVRIRAGTILLGSVVVLLALLNLMAGAA